MNATTCRPVISSTAALNCGSIAIWNAWRVSLTVSQSPALISVRSAGV